MTLHSISGKNARILSPWGVPQPFKVTNVQTKQAVPVNNDGNGIFSFKTVSKNDYTIQK